jgi:hypothetical protein
MVYYKLYYLNLRARGELIRWLFAYNGIEYEDFRFEFPEFFANFRQMAPFGAVT